MTPEAANDPERAGQPRLSVPRSHRLKRRRLIRPLFDRDRADVRTIPSGSIRAVYRVVDTPDGGSTPLQVGVFVSRRAGGAVRRNRIRRQMREAYRHRHPDLVTALAGRPGMLTLALVFRGSPDVDWNTLRRDVSSVVERLIRNLT